MALNTGLHPEDTPYRSFEFSMEGSNQKARDALKTLVDVLETTPQVSEQLSRGINLSESRRSEFTPDYLDAQRALYNGAKIWFSTFSDKDILNYGRRWLRENYNR